MLVSMYSNLVSFVVVAVLVTTQAWSTESPTANATPDSTISEQQLRSEESYFAISSLLDSKLETDQLIDSLSPYTRDLSPYHRNKLYKQYSRYTVYSTLGIGPIMSVLQGDGLGIGLFLGGVAIGTSGAYLAAREDVSAAIGGAMLWTGIGCVVASAIRAGSVNTDRREYNNVLRAALRVPEDMSYSLTPSIMSLPNGTVAPSLTFVLTF